MKVLLDTHAALWWLVQPDRVGTNATALMLDGGNRLLLSSVSVWEVAIKEALGKIEPPADFADTLLDGGVRPLAIGIDHATEVGRLPALHKDPFDRMLVAQARVEGAMLVSADPALAAYDVPVVW